MKLLIFLLIGYICYRTVKNWMMKNPSFQGEVPSNPAAEIDDIMLKDPYCGVYFPQRNGVLLNENGTDLYFCSEECQQKYIAQKEAEGA